MFGPMKSSAMSRSRSSATSRSQNGSSRASPVTEILGPELGMALEQPVHVRVGLGDQAGVEDISEDDVTLVLALPLGFGLQEHLSDINCAQAMLLPPARRILVLS